jgi:predicted ATPase
MAADLATLLQHLRDGTGRVELDLPPPQGSNSIEVAAQLARERRIAISRGERVAYLYLKSESDWSVSVKVTEGESRVLVEAGAKWIGPDADAPKRPMLFPTRVLKQFNLYDFKAHATTELRLSRLTMLVGDNASGKTSVLEALALLGSLRPPFDDILKGHWTIPNLLRRGASSRQIALAASGALDSESWTTTIRLMETAELKYAIEARSEIGPSRREASASGDGQGFGHGGDWEGTRAVIGFASMYALRAERISAAAYSYDPKVHVGRDGTDTAVVLAAMKLGDDERFEIIEEAMRRLVPSLERIRIRSEMIVEGVGAAPISHRASKIHFDFRGAKDIPADSASSGTLILLSLLTIFYAPVRPDLILIDDFEQALHPRAQRELVHLLKDLLELPEFANLQIVATTHSPYVLDLLDPSDIYAFALREDGTVASKLLSEHPDAEKMKGSLTAGQLWSLDEERSWVLK